MLKNFGTIVGCVKGLTYPTKHFLPAVEHFSTIPQRKIRDPHQMKFLPQKDLEDYMAYMPKFIDDVTSKEVLLDYPLVTKRMKNLLEYMCPKGKHLRQHLLIYTYKAIEEHHRTFAPENMEEVYKMCWSLEMYNTVLVILDDILDDHDIRRNKPTWYKMEGTKSVNDMVVVYTGLFGILKKYFSHYPRYQEINDVFQSPKVPISLMLELEMTNFDDFTIERCDEIAEIKSAYFANDQPFLLATFLANKELQMYPSAHKVFYHLGNLYSAQNDVLDVYGQDITGKSSTDIVDNNCTYLIAMARLKANDSQMKVLKECYGKRDQKCVDRVIGIYDELDILGEYYKLEEKYCEKATEEIRKIQDEFSRSLLEKLAYVQSFGLIGIPPL